MNRDMPIHVVRGFLMGAADIIPGVSGGTVALILGIYERLVSNIRIGAGSLSRLVRGDVKGFWKSFTSIEWAFLGPLVIGIGLAVILMATPITWLLEHHPRPTAGVFFGLIAGSIAIAWQLLGQRDVLRAMVMAATAVAAFFILGLRGGEVVDPSSLLFFGAGALAICAMILPGVSGSFILLMIGMYQPLLEAVHDRSIATLLTFIIGAVVGLAMFSTLLNWLLDNHHDTMLAGLIGLMIGSLRVLWPWPDGTESTVLGAPDTQVGLIAGLAVISFLAVFSLAKFSPGETKMRAGADAR
ncbi:MAG: DUF368 domain-containing protein [Acidimicrobiia bacterium]|nr:DUF368 domain-containing protein [Acidimicrobiia bacterium]